jgi:hypothetical protein
MLNALLFHGDHLKPVSNSTRTAATRRACVTDLKRRVIPGGRAGQDRPEHAGLAAGRTGKGRTPTGQRNGQPGIPPGTDRGKEL